MPATASGRGARLPPASGHGRAEHVADVREGEAIDLVCFVTGDVVGLDQVVRHHHGVAAHAQAVHGVQHADVGAHAGHLDHVRRKSLEERVELGPVAVSYTHLRAHETRHDI